MRCRGRSLWAILAVNSVFSATLWAQEPQVAAPAAPPAPSSTKHSDATRGWLPPGEDPENRLILPFVKHLGQDQQAFWMAPLHLHKNDWQWLAPFAGFTAALVASDSWMSKQVPDTPSQIKRSNDISNYAVFSLIGVGGGSFLLGHLTGSDHLQEAGLLSGEAAINSTAVAYLLKEITQRPRPYQGNEHGSFFQGGTSFPSEHSAIAWSVASVWAHEYPGTLSQIFAYGLASAVTVSRVTGRQHFPADAFIGSALGWYFGRQVYRAHHNAELGGTSWGSPLPESTGEKTRNPENMGSPYVPLDNWVYPALERLAALGYIQTAYLGIRPWTRMECARLVDEASDSISDTGDSSEDAARLYQELAQEFAPERGRLDGHRNLGATLESVYTRVTNISGPPLRDGHHFGQTIIDDYGRPYGEGVNLISGASTDAVAGPFSFYVRGEYQQAGSVPAVSQQTLQAMANADFSPVFGSSISPPGFSADTGSYSRFRLLEGAVAFTFHDVQFSFGKQSAWLGPGEGGPLLLSDNAEPIPMLRIDNVSAFHFPGLSRILGPAHAEFFLGRLSGQRWVAVTPDNAVPPASIVVTTPGMDLIALTAATQPFIHGEKISFKPTPNLEFGMGVTYVFGGPGFPFTWARFAHTYSLSSGVVNGPDSSGDRRSAFDFNYRIPKLRNWLLFYLDSFTEDEISPIGSNRPALNLGLYFPQVPKIPRLDIRAEGVYTNAPNLTNGINGFVYWNARYPDNYTNNGNLMASWVGRQGEGEQGWATYWLSSRNKIELGFRHQEVDKVFIGGGRLTDVSAGVDLSLRHGLSVLGSAQYENWRFPVLAATPKSDIATSLQLTFWPTRAKDK